MSRERVVNAANFRSDFSSASRERASGADSRRTGRCARRPPSSRRSIGTVTSGRAAVASSSPRPHPAFARSPERHRPPRTECPPWNRRQPARAARSARRTGGWGGSVCSRRCAPRPLAAAARPEHRENNTNFSSNFNSASRVGARRAPRARVAGREVVNAANFRSDFNSASRERASGADSRRTGRCARRPPSWRRSIGTVTSGRAAVASSSPRPHPAFARSPRRVAIGRPAPNARHGIGGSRREPLGRRGAPAAGAGRSAHADARRAPSRPRRGQSTGRTTPISAAISTARAESGARRAPRARVSRERVVNAANFRSDFSSASRERASGADGRRTGRCARRPPSWRRSIGTVTSGRAAVASSSPRPHPAFARAPRATIGKSATAPHRMPAMESAAAGASRSVGAAHRRLGRVGLLTPMRAAPPRGRGAARAQGEQHQFQQQFQQREPSQGLAAPLARA